MFNPCSTFLQILARVKAIMTIQTVIQLFGGIGVFLFAIKLISDSLQLLAGDRLRNIVGMLTRTPFLGVLVGTGVTILIQSSSAVTVMTVSFVDAGLMTLKQAIGVIMGANIGTTVTGQILAINIKDFVYVFIIIGIPLSFFCKSKQYQYLGNGLIGFGLLFMGMQTMEGSMSFLRQREDIFLAFSHNPFLGLLAGMMLTLLVQSSSATVGLTIALGTQGLLSLQAAIPIVLGDNIGTTITAVLASIGTNRTAKQACTAHVLFNVIGVCIFLPLMPLYMDFIQSTSSTIGHQIANAHTLFNVCNTLLFLPFIGFFSKLIQTLVPNKPQIPQHSQDTQYLDPKLINVTPVMAVQAVKNECVHMAELTLFMLDSLEKVFFRGQQEYREKVLELEERLDALNKSIQAYADNTLRSGISDDTARYLHAWLTCSSDLERIGDANRQLLHFYDYRINAKRDFSLEAMKELAIMYGQARQTVSRTLEGISSNDFEKLFEVANLASHVREMEADLRMAHIERLSQGICDAQTGLIYIDVLGAIEHMAYRARKIARTFKTMQPGPPDQTILLRQAVK